MFLIDPSYLIRSVPANSGDNMLCIQLAQAAVHTAFSGYSGVTVGKFHDLFGIMPINMVVAGSRKVNPKGSLWQTVKSRLAFYPGERHLSKKGTRCCPRTPTPLANMPLILWPAFLLSRLPPSIACVSGCSIVLFWSPRPFLAP